MRDKAFNIAKNPKYDGYQRELASIVYKLFDKKISGGATESENMSNKDSSEELLKPIITKLEIKKSTLTFYRQYLGSWSCQYAINKQI